VTAPIEAVLGVVSARVLGVRVDRLTVTHPVDDDLWFIRRSLTRPAVQIESRPEGQPPFIIEIDGHDRRLWASTADEAIEVIEEWLRDSN
jgi:hypothetical protein